MWNRNICGISQSHLSYQPKLCEVPADYRETKCVVVPRAMVKRIQDQRVPTTMAFMWSLVGIINKECNLNSSCCKVKEQSKLEVPCLVLITKCERCKWIAHTRKEISELMQTRSMIGMQVLQSNPTKILHQQR